MSLLAELADEGVIFLALYDELVKNTSSLTSLKEAKTSPVETLIGTILLHALHNSFHIVGPKLIRNRSECGIFKEFYKYKYECWLQLFARIA